MKVEVDVLGSRSVDVKQHFNSSRNWWVVFSIERAFDRSASYVFDKLSDIKKYF